MCFTSFSTVFCLLVAESLVWNTVAQATAVHNPDLVGLIAELPQVLFKARAPATNKAYGLAFKKWREWAANYDEVKALPANHLHVILYLIFLSRSAQSFAVVNVASCSIAWAHQLSGFDSPTNNILVIEALRGLRRTLAKPAKPKEPLTLQNIYDINDKTELNSVKDVRDTTMILLAFYAFLRVSELMHLRSEHIIIKENHLELAIPSSKCDQLRQGCTVVVARLGGKNCPVVLLEHYLSLANIDLTVKQFIFRRFCLYSGGLQLYKQNVAISYSLIRDIVKTKVEQIGLDPSEFGTHSMRAGGATTAANRKVNDRLFQRHGRWATSQSKNRYIRDSLANRLGVSQALSMG
jgi:integrase